MSDSASRPPRAPSGMKHWRIYYADREYAREHGDPCLGIVFAPDKLAAEEQARAMALGGIAGVLACESVPANRVVVRKNASDPTPPRPAALSTREGWIAGAEQSARAHGLEPEDPRLRGALRNALTAPWATYVLLREAAEHMIEVCAELRDESRFWCHEPSIQACQEDAQCTYCRFASAVVRLRREVQPPSEE